MTDQVTPATDKQINVLFHSALSDSEVTAWHAWRLKDRIDAEKARADRAAEDVQSLTEQVALLFRRLAERGK